METTLVLSRGGFPPFSSRGCIQELTPIIQGHFRRTVNGTLLFTGSSEKKYKTTISCQDTAVMATDGLTPGSIIDVSCIQPLWQKIEKGKGTLERMPVEGSICAFDMNKKTVPITRSESKCVEVETKEDVYLSYRPFLTMRLVSYTLKTNEWGAKSGWSLELEEV